MYFELFYVIFESSEVMKKVLQKSEKSIQIPDFNSQKVEKTINLPSGEREVEIRIHPVFYVNILHDISVL